MIIVLLWVGGCQQKNSHRTIGDEKMINILVEMHIAEAAVSTMHRDTMAITKKKFMRKIAQIYSTTESEIDNNIIALQASPDQLRLLQASVVKKLQQQQDSMDVKLKKMK